MDDHAPGPPRLTRRLDTWLTKLGVGGRFARDCLLAVAVAVLTAALLPVVIWFVGQVEGAPVFAGPLITVVCCAQALLLCLRRTRPLLCLALVVAAQVVVVAVGPADGTFRGLATFIAAYTVATVLPVRTAYAVAGATVVLETAGVLAVFRPAEPGLLFTLVAHVGASVLCYFGSTFVGVYVATRRSYVELVRLQADAAIRVQRATAQAAIGAERSRMARELHDVAAHHLSGMVVQAAAVERLIERDPQAARDGVVWIRSQGKETLDNLRLVVGVLRGRPTGDEGNAPVPGLAMLDELVGTARDLDTPVELVREGTQRELAPIADVALYRMVQESLSNARQHALGAPVRVALRFAPREVSLEIVNDPGPGRPGRAGSGVGLIGMRERAQLIGAQFTAGPTAAGGWRVTATLPTAQESA